MIFVSNVTRSIAFIILLKLSLYQLKLDDTLKSAFFNWNGLDMWGFDLSLYFVMVTILFLNSISRNDLYCGLYFPILFIESNGENALFLY